MSQVTELAHDLSNSTPFANTSSVKPPSVYDVYKTFFHTWMVIVFTTNILGVALNGVTFVATITYRPLRNSSSCVLLAHCILIDLIWSLCVGPGLVLVTYFGPISLPANFCRGWGAVVWGTSYTSNWSHSILAIHRFTASVFPYQYKLFTTRRMLVSAVAFPWFAAVLLNSFMVAQMDRSVHYELARPWTSCTPGPATFKPLNALVAFGVYIPCCVTGLGYAVVLVTSKIAVKKRALDILHRSALQKRYETSKMLVASFLWNSISNFAVPIAATCYSAVYFTSPVLQLSLKALQYVSCAVNPVSFTC